MEAALRRLFFDGPLGSRSRTGSRRRSRRRRRAWGASLSRHRDKSVPCHAGRRPGPGRGV